MQESHSRHALETPKAAKDRGQQSYLLIYHIINNLGFIGQIVSVTASQLGHYNVKATTGNTYE